MREERRKDPHRPVGFMSGPNERLSPDAKAAMDEQPAAWAATSNKSAV